jgi:hypothetical protein
LMQRNAVAHRSRRLVASMLLGRQMKSMMRVRTPKLNRSSMQAGVALARYWILECSPKRGVPRSYRRTFEYGPKTLVTLRKAGRGSTRHS